MDMMLRRLMDRGKYSHCHHGGAHRLQNGRPCKQNHAAKDHRGSTWLLTTSPPHHLPQHHFQIIPHHPRLQSVQRPMLNHPAIPTRDCNPNQPWPKRRLLTLSISQCHSPLPLDRNWLLITRYRRCSYQTLLIQKMNPSYQLIPPVISQEFFLTYLQATAHRLQSQLEQQIAIISFLLIWIWFNIQHLGRQTFWEPTSASPLWCGWSHMVCSTLSTILKTSQEWWRTTPLRSLDHMNGLPVITSQQLQQVQESQEIHRRSSILSTAVFQQGGFAGSEQPINSLAWQQPCHQHSLKQCSCYFVATPACKWGRDWFKTWAFAAASDNIQSLADQCCHQDHLMLNILWVDTYQYVACNMQYVQWWCHAWTNAYMTRRDIVAQQAATNNIVKTVVERLCRV